MEPSACSLAPAIQNPFSLKRSMDCTRLATCVTGRCEMAPAELLYVAAVTRAARLFGMTMPEAPTDSALRAMAPRLPASVMWSSMTTSARPPFSAALRSAACRMAVTLT